MLFLDVNKDWCVSSIECFHSRGQHLCKFIRTKESVCIRKEFNSQRIGLKKPTWPPFHCFGTPIWPPWRHVKTPYRPFQHVLFVLLSFDNTQRTLSFEFSSYSCAYEKTKGQIPLRPNLHRENSKSTWRASQVVRGGGVLPIMAYTRRLHPKGVPSSGFM